MSTKQIIVVRTKYANENGLTGLRKGIIISQACHASMSFLTKRLQSNEPLTEVQKEWLENSFTKICVKVQSEQELLDIEKRAIENNIECHVITDNGKTEFNGVPTKTCLALGPDKSSVLDKITGHLSLW